MQIPAFLDPRDLVTWVNDGVFSQGLALAKVSEQEKINRVFSEENAKKARVAFFRLMRNSYCSNESEVTALKNVVSEFGAPAIRTLLVMWHEQRHFLDHILTNYGASKVRIGFMIRSQADAILQSAIVRNQLALPIRAYRDPLRLKIMGIDVAGQHPLAGLGAFLAERAEMDKTDGLEGFEIAKRSTTFRDKAKNPVALSGYNMFEALATLAQGQVLERNLGIPLGGAQWEELGAAYTRFPYVAAFGDYLEGAGIHTISEHVNYQNRTVIMLLKPALLSAILVACLMCRRSASATTNSDDSAFYPTRRLLRISEELRYRKIGEVNDPEEAFQYIDHVCRFIWRRSIADDLEEDIEFSEKEASKFSAVYNEDRVNAAFMDSYIAMRKAVFSQFIRSPGAFCCGRNYCKNVVPAVRPKVVYVESSADGVVLFATDEQVRDGVELVDGLDYKFDLLQWGAGQLGNGPTNFVKAHCYELRDPQSGSAFGAHMSTTHSEHTIKTAGFVRLILSGRAEAVGVDALLYHAEKTITGNGIRIVFERGHEYPSISRDPSYLFEMFGMSEMRCDVTDEMVNVNNSAIVSPWEFKKFPKLWAAAEANRKLSISPIIDDEGGGGFGDWNPWLVRNDLLR